jgi:hypothetical protein
LFNCEWVAGQTLSALRSEIEIYLPNLPHLEAIPLLTTLETYHALAVAYVASIAPQLEKEARAFGPSDAWQFWRRNYLQLPVWYDGAAEVALVFTSSAMVERCFSLYEAMVSSLDTLALEDRREASVKLSFNKQKRKSEASEAKE